MQDKPTTVWIGSPVEKQLVEDLRERDYLIKILPHPSYCRASRTVQSNHRAVHRAPVVPERQTDGRTRNPGGPERRNRLSSKNVKKNASFSGWKTSSRGQFHASGGGGISYQCGIASTVARLLCVWMCRSRALIVNRKT